MCAKGEELRGQEGGLGAQSELGKQDGEARRGFAEAQLAQPRKMRGLQEISQQRVALERRSRQRYLGSLLGIVQEVSREGKL
ncbi:MAG TPA: hypothetical protein V6D20_19815 [Candidatus Obscuribacterales bacterium]